MLTSTSATHEPTVQTRKAFEPI